jgi:hypothetical protein
VRPTFQPATWLLPLTSGAKQLVTTFIVLGSLFVVGYVAAYALVIASVAKLSTSVNDPATAITAISQLNSSYSTLTDRMDGISQAASSCGQSLACVHQQDQKASTASIGFSGEVADIPMPDGAAAAKAKLSAAASLLAQDYRQLSEASSIDQYQSTFNKIGLQQAINGLNQDMTALVKNLRSY